MVAFIIVIAWYLCRGSYRLHKISCDAHNKRHECAHIVAASTFFKMAMASEREYKTAIW
jgi:hypothetical protein